MYVYFFCYACQASRLGAAGLRAGSLGTANVAVYDGLALHKPDEPWLALGVWSLGRRV